MIHAPTVIEDLVPLRPRYPAHALTSLVEAADRKDMGVDRDPSRRRIPA